MCSRTKKPAKARAAALHPYPSLLRNAAAASSGSGAQTEPDRPSSTPDSSPPGTPYPSIGIGYEKWEINRVLRRDPVFNPWKARMAKATNIMSFVYDPSGIEDGDLVVIP
jgi:hypothetical protein